jgi:hypothetical protein
MEDFMKLPSILLVLVTLLSACGPRPEVGNTISSCREKVDAVASLIGGLEFPANFQVENPVKTGTEFDVMQYFTILDHLSMQPGYLLDYVYHFDGMGGYPFLYARPASQPPYATEADLPAGSTGTEYLQYVRIDDTSEGYFQFVLLSLMGSQFYLFWHADYNDSQIVCDRTGVGRIISSLNGDFGYRISIASRVRAFLLNDVSPTVVISDETVKVQFVTFTRWGGFFQQTYTLSRTMPLTIQDMEKKNLVPYECGVMF